MCVLCNKYDKYLKKIQYVKKTNEKAKKNHLNPSYVQVKVTRRPPKKNRGEGYNINDQVQV